MVESINKEFVVVVSVDKDWTDESALLKALKDLDATLACLVVVEHYREKTPMVRAAIAATGIPVRFVRPSRSHGRSARQFAHFRSFSFRRPMKVMVFSEGLSEPLDALARFARGWSVPVHHVIPEGRVSSA